MSVTRSSRERSVPRRNVRRARAGDSSGHVRGRAYPRPAARRRQSGGGALAGAGRADAAALARDPGAPDADVQKAAATGGSSKFWQPLRRSSPAYGVRPGRAPAASRHARRRSTKAIAMEGPSGQEPLRHRQGQGEGRPCRPDREPGPGRGGELDRPAAPAPQPRTATQARPTQPRPTHAMAIGGGGRRGAEAVDESGGTSSFQEAIRVPGLGDLSDAPSGQRDVQRGHPGRSDQASSADQWRPDAHA